MLEYVTVADVDALLGNDWTTADNKAVCVKKANLWLNSKIVKDVGEPIPDDVKLAGAQMAKLAASGGLFCTKQREVLSSDVSAASGTHVKKTFQSGSISVAAEESFALALISPWMGGIGSVIMLKRI